MTHLQLVRTNGREVTPPAPAQRLGGRSLHLPRLDISGYSDMLARQDEDAVLMRRDARVDARRLVRRLRAIHPIAEVGDLCIWNLVGDLLCHLVPLSPSIQELEDAAHALRLVVRLVADGEALGAGMMFGDTLLSIHGEGCEGTIDLAFDQGDAHVEMRFRIVSGIFEIIS